MGSLQRQVAVMVPDKKLHCFDLTNFFPKDQNNLAYHLGAGSPPSGDGFKIWLPYERNLSIRSFYIEGILF